MLIKKAHQSLLRSCEEPTSHPTLNEFSKLPNSAAFEITIGGNRVCIPVWCGKKYLMDQVCFNSNVMKWIELSNKNKNFFFYDVEQFFAHLEYVRNGIMFRCHPNYRSTGEWYDWVMVRFDIASHKRSCSNRKLGMWSSHYYPSKIMCFFRLPEDETIYAIVHSTKPSNHDSNSILFERWELENTITDL